MFRTLLKKQLRELFAFYLIDKRTGKARTKGKMTGLMLLLAFLFVIFFFMFFSVSMAFASMLFDAESGIEDGNVLFFSIIGIMALVFGTFGSIFNTYSSLYQAKDNEFLLSLPVPPSYILASRLCGTFLLGMFYIGMIWIPAIVACVIMTGPDAYTIIIGILLLPFLSMLTTSVSCLLGWIVALISRRLKRKNVIAVILSLAFFLGYYYICFNAQSIFESLILNIGSTETTIKSWMYPMYLFGQGAAGNVLSLILFIGIAVAAFAACCVIMSLTFIRIVTYKGQEKTAVPGRQIIKESNVSASLLKKEFRSFAASPTYMLNCGLGIFFAVVLAVLMVVKSGQIKETLSMVFSEAGSVLYNIIPGALFAITALLITTNPIAAPSVSLEGNTMWLIHSLPVWSGEVIKAKMKVHIILNMLPAVVLPLTGCIVFGADIPSTLVLLILSVAFNIFTAEFCMIAGLKHANLNWTNEAMVVKQGAHMLIALFGGWLISFVTGGACIALSILLPSWAAMLLPLALIVAIDCILYRFLIRKGTVIFDNL